jgi:hypothetical protein
MLLPWRRETLAINLPLTAIVYGVLLIDRVLEVSGDSSVAQAVGLGGGDLRAVRAAVAVSASDTV